MMTATIDVEITSETTARVNQGSGVAEIELAASATESLQKTIHRYVHDIAKQVDAPVEVTYRSGQKQRLVTVHPDGSAEVTSASGPMPVVPSGADPQPNPMDRHLLPRDTDSEEGPVVVDATAIGYAQPSTPAERRPQAPVAARPTSRPVNREVSLTAPRMNPASTRPAELGVRGRINALFGTKLTPKSDSAEFRLRESIGVIVGPVPDSATVTIINTKGAAGKTPIAVGLSATLGTHRGASSVVLTDMAEVGGSLADRVATPPEQGHDILAMLAQIDPEDFRPGPLTRFLTRQPTGDDVLAGRQDAHENLTYEAAAATGAILSQHRDIVIADTGNNPTVGSWQWSIDAATVLVVPVPLRRDAAAKAQRNLSTVLDARPGLLSRTVVVITDGPGDAPMVETEVVDAFTDLGIRNVCRMPYEPQFACGDRIHTSRLQSQTNDALTVLAATIVELMGGAH